MTQPPVTLAEFRDQLNVDAADTVRDEERWSKLLAATNHVEERCGAMRVRTVTERVYEEGGALLLSSAPLVEVTGVTYERRSGGSVVAEPLDLDHFDVDVDAGMLTRAYGSMPRGAYAVTYKVGRDPVPESLREATLIIAEQLWSSQRGPAVARTNNQGATTLPRGFAVPARAMELMAPFENFVGLR